MKALKPTKGKSEMKVEQVLMTPEMAKEHMKKNTNNRTFRKSWAEYFSAEIRRGNWIPNIDPIAVSKDGVLLNGQHRLSGIIQSGQSVMVLLATNVDPRVFEVTDRGLSRSLHDVTGLSNAAVAEASLIAHIIDADNTHRIPTDVVKDIWAWWRPASTTLHSYIAGKNSAGLSNAHIRVGYGLRWAVTTSDESRKYVLNQYHALMYGDMPKMSMATASLWRRMLQAKNSGSRVERIRRCALTFRSSNPGRANVEPFIRDPDVAVGEITTLLKATEAAYLRAPQDGHPYQYTETTVTTHLKERKKRQFKLLGDLNDEEVAELRTV